MRKRLRFDVTNARRAKVKKVAERPKRKDERKDDRKDERKDDRKDERKDERKDVPFHLCAGQREVLRVLRDKVPSVVIVHGEVGTGRRTAVSQLGNTIWIQGTLRLAALLESWTSVGMQGRRGFVVVTDTQLKEMEEHRKRSDEFHMGKKKHKIGISDVIKRHAMTAPHTLLVVASDLRGIVHSICTAAATLKQVLVVPMAAPTRKEMRRICGGFKVKATWNLNEALMQSKVESPLRCVPRASQHHIFKDADQIFRSHCFPEDSRFWSEPFFLSSIAKQITGSWYAYCVAWGIKNKMEIVWLLTQAMKPDAHDEVWRALHRAVRRNKPVWNSEPEVKYFGKTTLWTRDVDPMHLFDILHPADVLASPEHLFRQFSRGIGADDVATSMFETRTAI